MAKKVFVFVLATAILFSVQLANTQPTGKVWRIGLFHVGLDQFRRRWNRCGKS